MCGFGGIINSGEPVSKKQLAKIAGDVKFRGPDSCGLLILDNSLNKTDTGNSALFFNRLAIIDLDPRSDQPFEDDTHILIFNGEIYNYTELRKELERENVSFRTTSDTEVLFYALREWGPPAISRLNGMFAFFWLNKKDRTFLIARDRLGIKPLCYSVQGNTFIYASEITSIIRLSQSTSRISTDAVNMYLWMQFVPTPHTIIEGVCKLPPGNYLTGEIDNMQSLRLTCYWNAYDFVSFSSHNSSPGLEAILKSSLQRQLHADVPLGLFLSSGVDSSLLTAMVNKYFSRDAGVNFFTVRFEEHTTSDESEDAAKFIDGFNNPMLHFNTIRINPSFIQEHLEELYNYYDEPFGDPASLLNWAVSKKAREHVTVAISGDGADELFWGYHRYIRWQKFKKASSLAVISDLIQSVNRLLPQSRLSDNVRFLLEKDPVKRHFNFFLPSGMRSRINKHITYENMWALEHVEKIAKKDDLPAILDIKTYLADAMLYKVDRSSMASSLEVRVPYLDNEVLEFALGMPLSEKSNAEFITKAPLKQLLSQLAPHYDLNRQKKGFSFPLRKWLKESWKDKVLAVVNRENLIHAGLDPAPYLKLVKDFYSSNNNYFTDVWFIFNLCLWVEKFKSIEKHSYE